MLSEYKFLVFWTIIILPFITGALINKKLSNTQRTAKFLININLFFLEPAILLWTIWGLKLNKQLIILPVTGLLTVFAGFAAGRLFLPFLKLEKTSRASYLISSSLSNQGMTMGGLLCYIISGEEGLALASIYIIYYLPFVFTVIFPYARMSSANSSPELPGFSLKQIKFFFFNLQNLPLAGILIAIILQVCGFDRPGFNFPLDIFLGTAISIYYLTLGINFRAGDLLSFIPELTAISFTKFIILPLLTFISLQFIDINMNIKTVIMMQSFAPAAIYSVISSILYDLDTRLTSGIFVMNSLVYLCFVMPLLILFGRALIN